MTLEHIQSLNAFARQQGSIDDKLGKKTKTFSS